MSLLVDPEYFLHTLKLNYLRRLPDPTGPSAISFSNQHPTLPHPSSSSSSSQKLSSELAQTPPNPYIQLSGLSDSSRWPELFVRGSPPEPFSLPTNQSVDNNTPIRARRRRADGTQPPNPSNTTLRYSETIVGPRASGLSAGMRVSGRKSIRVSRLPSKLIPDPKPITSTPPTQPSAGLHSHQDQASNVGANALALTEGRASLIPGGGLNPEDSDEDTSHAPLHSTLDDLNTRRPISRNPTTTTIKTRRRRISAVTFANSSISFASPPGSILNLSLSRHRTRAQRGHSISSIATTNTVVSSDFSEHANQTQLGGGTFNSPTTSQPPTTGDLTNRNPPNQSIESTDQPSSPINQPPLNIHQTDAEFYYSNEHDHDKRMSDMLFTFRPFESKRSTQIVGSVELEPAPLVEADNEDDTCDEDIETDQTDTGTEQGEDDSSFNFEEIGEDTSILDDSVSIKSRRLRFKRRVGSIGTNSIEIGPAEEIGQASTIKPLSNTLATSSVDSNPPYRVPGQSNDANHGPERSGAGGQSPPIVRRRERRRVNIKMGKLLGPPIIEEDLVGALPDSDLQPTKPLIPRPSAPASSSSRSPRVISSVSRPSLPDLRQAINNSSVEPHESPHPESFQSAKFANSFSPGRARALTTPTPIPSIAVDSNLSHTSTVRNTFSRISRKRSSGLDPLGASNYRSDSRSPTIKLSSDLLQASLTQPGLKITGTANNPLLKPPLQEKIGTVSKSPKKTKRPQLTFKKIDLEDPKNRKPVVQKSILTQLLNAQSSSTSSENPFRCFYALLASKERNALKITMYYPFSKEPRKPIKISMKADVCVEEVVGFALWNYVDEDREPKIAEIKKKPEALDLADTSAWCLMLVEDDGQVDEDFPALERTRPAAKVGSNEFAIVMATEVQAQQNQLAQTQIQRRPSRVLGEPKRAPRAAADPAGVRSLGATSLLPPLNAMQGNSGSIFDGTRAVGGGLSGSLLSGGYGSTALGGPSFTVAPVYLKIRIPSPGKGVDSIITTMNVTVEMYLADVLETLVKKKSLGQVKDWALLVPSSPSIPIHQRDIVVPLDRTVESLQGVTSLALVKRTQVSSKLLRNARLDGGQSAQNTNPSASIFKRLSEVPQPKYVSITDLTSSSKTFLVQTKRRGILGKSDRLLTIEDDYVHLSPNHQSVASTLNLANGDLSAVSGKVASYHISQILDCIPRHAGFKLVVLRDSGEKRYDVEAENPQSAAEIVRHIKGLKEMYHSTRS